MKGRAQDGGLRPERQNPVTKRSHDGFFEPSAQPLSLSAIPSLHSAHAEFKLEQAHGRKVERFPIDGLKIDRTFVEDMLNDTSDAGIVSAVIAMAQALNLRVTAEGVETEEQLAFLAGHDCTAVQGFLFGQPMASEQVSQLVRSGATRSIARMPFTA